MAYILRDDQAPSYHELWDIVVAAAVTKGFGAVVQDVFGFYMVAGVLGDEVCFIYEARQVRTGKLTGTGEGILAGQRVYATLASAFQLVTVNPAGVIGVNFYFVGWAKKDSGADEDEVLIRFWGHEYDHADRA